VSDRIPVFVLPLQKGASHPKTVAAAQEAVATASESAETSGLRVAVSTNWWHLLLAGELCRAWGISGLEFLAHDLRLLSPSESGDASEAVASLLDHLESTPIPPLRQQFGPELSAIQNADLPGAIAATLPSFDIDDDDAEVESFLSFLVSLQEAAIQAREAGEGLLFFRPGP
jgi:hypothetical protein